MEKFNPKENFFLILLLNIFFFYSNQGFSKESINFLKKDINILIKGNKRTKNHYIISVLNNCSLNLKKGISQKTIPFFEQCLLDTRLFSKVKITIALKKVTIEIIDRWTLIPIPYIKSQGQAKTFGFFLLDTNLLGYGKMITLGAIFGQEGKSYFLMFRDPSLFFSKWSGGFIIRNMKREHYNHVGDEPIEGFNERSASLGAYLGHKIFPKTNFSFSLSQNKKEFSQLKNYAVPEDNHFFLLGLRLGHRGSQFKFYFKEGLDTSLLFTYPFGQKIKGAESPSLRFNLSLQKNNYSDHVIQIGFKHFQVFNPEFGNDLKVGGERGLRGLPLKGVWVERISALSTDYQIPFYHSKYGTWTLSSFIDLGHAKTKMYGAMTNTSFYSFGVGSTFFLKKVNFPGLGIFYGHNPKYLGNFFSFTLGRGL